MLVTYRAQDNQVPRITRRMRGFCVLARRTRNHAQGGRAASPSAIAHARRRQPACKNKTARRPPSPAMPPPRQIPARWGGGVPPPLTLPPSKLCSRRNVARRAQTARHAPCALRSPGRPLSRQSPCSCFRRAPARVPAVRARGRPRSARAKALARARCPVLGCGLAGALGVHLPSPAAPRRGPRGHKPSPALWRPLAPSLRGPKPTWAAAALFAVVRGVGIIPAAPGAEETNATSSACDEYHHE